MATNRSSSSPGSSGRSPKAPRTPRAAASGTGKPGRPRKVKAPESDVAADDSAVDDIDAEVEEEAPKPKRRTTKKAEPTKAEAAPVESVAKAESTVKSRRTAKAPPPVDDDFGAGVDLPEDPSAESEEDEAPKRTRATRKAAPAPEPTPAPRQEAPRKAAAARREPAVEKPPVREAAFGRDDLDDDDDDVRDDAFGEADDDEDFDDDEDDSSDDSDADAASGTAEPGSEDTEVGPDGVTKKRRRRKRRSVTQKRETAAKRAEEEAKRPPQNFRRGGYQGGGGGYQQRSGYQGGGSGGSGGYQSREGNQGGQGGYQPREGGSGYQGGGGGGYQSREGGSGGSGYQQRDSGYQGGGGGGGGGYQQRDSGYQQGGSGGYQSRFNRGPDTGGGYRDREGGQFQKRRPSGPMGKSQRNAAPEEAGATSGLIEGILELHPKGYGFLRSPANDYGARETDPFVSSTYVEKHHLREGIMISAEIGPGIRGQGPRVLEMFSIEGRPIEEYENLKHFDNLTAINPFEQIKLEIGPTPISMRVMDLLTPIGKGQRALIVAPPRTGKTMLLHDIANSVAKNHPEIHIIVLLVDERPEEVTEIRRTVKGEVIASSMDRDVESHVRISQLVIERAKRIAERGGHAFVLLDSITRTARAFNKWVGGGRESKIGTGGLDVRALEIPRRMFGTARRFDEGGSVTVVGTALIDTTSKMDDAIFQEFKGTGNMEMMLSRDLADRRIWPAIDITRSGTRREEKLLAPEIMDGVTMLRRSLVNMNPTEAMDQLSRTLSKFTTNKEFLEKLRSIL